ncbi:cysteine hydrolase family protein [Streptomyces alanosinicus]|uniref:Isochorismatase n=1 Tax=Streptomyces alanosinicus TaxID=68171 RepID=A0A918YNU0_9ACTN|nr:cysteine hydrolase family protein [Streptomyces alanosinicus]GHE10259.1 isochorismatase [Streptomyces alanosinicus]
MATTTLRQLNNLDETPASLAEATVILIDFQNTYTSGTMELDGWAEAVAEGKKLLTAARQAGATIIHVQDQGYEPETEGGKIIADVAPIDGEHRVIKSVPNAFHNTNLAELVEKAGHENLVLAGFMTNMCVLFTAQGAFLNGKRPTVVAKACATRALPTTAAGQEHISAQHIHDGALATITELYGVVVPTTGDLK